MTADDRPGPTDPESGGHAAPGGPPRRQWSKLGQAICHPVDVAVPSVDKSAMIELRHPSPFGLSRHNAPWFAVGFATLIAALYWLDRPISAWGQGLPDNVRAVFFWLTDWGKSDWILVPTFIGWLVAWLIVPLIGAMVYEVVARYFFRAPTVWAQDLSYMLYGALFMLGGAYTLRWGGHIRTDFLYDRFGVRGQALVDAIAYLFFFFPAFGVFLWFGWGYFIDFGGPASTRPGTPLKPSLSSVRSDQPAQ